MKTEEDVWLDLCCGNFTDTSNYYPFADYLREKGNNIGAVLIEYMLANNIRFRPLSVGGYDDYYDLIILKGSCFYRIFHNFDELLRLCTKGDKLNVHIRQFPTVRYKDVVRKWNTWTEEDEGDEGNQ